MKNLKKNNKGFSLVELIVVVLIMAIIAVALAPQIMKWVKNSRITADQNACGNIKTAVQAGIADYQANGGVLVAQTFAKSNIGASGLTEETSKNQGGTKTLVSCINNALGGEKYNSKYDSTGFQIEIAANGGVKVTCTASTISLD